MIHDGEWVFPLDLFQRDTGLLVLDATNVSVNFILDLSSYSDVEVAQITNYQSTIAGRTEFTSERDFRGTIMVNDVQITTVGHNEESMFESHHVLRHDFYGREQERDAWYVDDPAGYRSGMIEIMSKELPRTTEEWLLI